MYCIFLPFLKDTAYPIFMFLTVPHRCSVNVANYHHIKSWQNLVITVLFNDNHSEEQESPRVTLGPTISLAINHHLEKNILLLITIVMCITPFYTILILVRLWYLPQHQCSDICWRNAFYFQYIFRWDVGIPRCLYIN